ncbi:uncharacterized protein LOC141632746 [Silene latifolia]|uniref:uncharacterized protein LOC141632746 n=1 Tax=Silene latifolia TaxID=37657 RepID=UPI003D780DAD
MAAVARPRYDEDGVVLFDGKIGIFPFVYEAEALRSSKNREKGTLEVKPIESITKEVIKQCLIERVIPAIKAKWPLNASRRIYIQQDNAKPHISAQDLDFLSVAKSDGFDIDLCPESILELIESVGKAYDEIDNEKLKFIWVSLHACMNEILRDEGNNSFPIPHIGKKKVQRTGILETKVKPNMECLQKALHALENINNNVEEPTQAESAQAETVEAETTQAAATQEG